MTVGIDCFKAYDVRGQIPGELNADIAYRIGNASAEFLGAKRIVVGRDMRLSSPEITDAVVKGLTEAGVDVLDIGLCGTEMVYFASAHLAADKKGRVHLERLADALAADELPRRLERRERRGRDGPAHRTAPRRRLGPAHHHL